MIDLEKLKGMKVLVVDDVPDNLKVLYNTLKSQGYDLSLVKSGKQALNHIPRYLPDLVLLDIVLPDVDGYEICRLLKQDEATRSIPIIFFSAKMDVADIVKGFELGGVDYITKPFVEAEVLARVRTHLAIKSLHEDLEHRIQHRTKALLKAKNLAEASSQAKSTFLSRMSHEFRTPLNAIMGFAQILQMGQPEAVPGDEKSMPDLILEASQHLLMLINDILEIESSGQGKISVSLAPCNLDQIIEESLSLVEKQAHDEGVTIARYKPSALCVQANHGRLKQVIVNLLSNAIKYNEQGGTVALTSYAVSDHEVVVSVRDSGWGIPPKDQQKIFKPFHRLASAEARAIQGTGVGLALTKYLVQQMGGRITVNSEADEGSDFCVTLAKASDKVSYPRAPDFGDPGRVVAGTSEEGRSTEGGSSTCSKKKDVGRGSKPSSDGSGGGVQAQNDS